MSAGRLTLKDLVARRLAQARAEAAARAAWAATPEGKAESAAFEAEQARLALADALFAEAHPVADEAEDFEGESES